MHGKFRRVSVVAVFFLCGAMTHVAFGDEIRGVVNDATGKPVRGAMVKASAGIKTVTRYSDSAGKFEITVPTGNYDITVDAFGFNLRRATADTSKPADLKISLTPGIEVSRLTSAQMQQLQPDSDATKAINGACIMCHNFGNIRKRAGYTAEEWKNFIPTMPGGKLNPPYFAPAALNLLTKDLESNFGPNSKYFGPDSEPPDPKMVTHLDPSDAVLKATYTEWTVPTRLEAMAHSVLISHDGYAWFTEAGLRANKLVRFDMKSEKFTEYDVHRPHTGVEGKDGVIWVTLTNGPPDLASVDPVTGKVTNYSTEGGAGGMGFHTPAIDLDGNIWCSGNYIFKFDVKTKKFTKYPVPVDSKYPPNSVYSFYYPADSPRSMEATGTFYDVKVDSKNKVWASIFSLGTLVRIDATTGKVDEFHAPNTPSIRAIDIDAQDNVWFAGFNGYNLGKFDQKTEKFSFYKPPTPFAMPYGVTANKKTGEVWVSDINGNNLSRFDPKTEEFTEYPIPSNNSIPKFMDFDKDGRLWFTEYINGKLGVLDTGDKTASR